MPNQIAHLNIQDTGDGGFDSQAVYVGGFDKGSPAHCAVKLLHEHLDTLGARRSVPPSELVEVIEAMPSARVEPWLGEEIPGNG